MNSNVSTQSLSAPRSGLLRLMQDINFGRIEGLTIRDGEPVLHPRPTVIRKVRFGGVNNPRPECGTADFLLKRKLIELFNFFDELRDGVIDTLVIVDGLPIDMDVSEVPA